jgi:uridine phosphorylase
LAPPIHLSPSADLAERVLLPGDPQRALRMAQELLDAPRMFNTRRGLWGYTGTTPAGLPVTIQATGMGGPSAAIVVEELIDLGARVLIRTGTCGALDEGYDLGDLVTATEVIASDGASRALGAGERLHPDRGLIAALVAHGGRPATAVSTDLFYDPRPGVEAAWRRAGAAVIEMEAAAVLAASARRGARAACLLLVTDVLRGDERTRIDQETVESRELALGEVALAALSSGEPDDPEGRKQRQ